MYGDLWLAEVDEKKNDIIIFYLYPLHKDCCRAVLEQEQTVSFFFDGTTEIPIYNVTNITKKCMLFPDKNKLWYEQINCDRYFEE